MSSFHNFLELITITHARLFLQIRRAPKIKPTCPRLQDGASGYTMSQHIRKNEKLQKQQKRMTTKSVSVPTRWNQKGLFFHGWNAKQKIHAIQRNPENMQSRPPKPIKNNIAKLSVFCTLVFSAIQKYGLNMY